MKGIQSILRSAASLTVLLILAACASTSKAPVEGRGAAGATKPSEGVESAPAVARPGYHIVKKGDTVYNIALENGQDWRDIISWNGLDNPNLILVGQELRVRPPDGGSSQAAAGSAGIESRPLEPKSGATSSAAAAKPDDGVRREPRGGKQPYSDQALATAQKTDEALRLAAKPENKTTSETKTEPTAAKPVDAKGDDEVEWVWPTAGKVLSSFSSSSMGMDIAGQLGETVAAAGAGKVTYVGSSLRGYGNLVIIKHTPNYMSVYAHNQKILVQEGQSVKKGQQIALLGESDADRPKLHFEIRRQGKPVDPLKYLPKR